MRHRNPHPVSDKRSGEDAIHIPFDHDHRRALCLEAFLKSDKHLRKHRSVRFCRGMQIVIRQRQTKFLEKDTVHQRVVVLARVNDFQWKTCCCRTTDQGSQFDDLRPRAECEGEELHGRAAVRISMIRSPARPSQRGGRLTERGFGSLA